MYERVCTMVGGWAHVIPPPREEAGNHGRKHNQLRVSICWMLLP